MQLSLEFPSLSVNCGSQLGMATKKYHILAKCYDKRGKLLSVASNRYDKTHPIQKYFARKVNQPECEFLHAEIHAILRAKGRSIYRLTIERYNALGLPANAKPCPICQEAIKAFSIPVVEYTK